MTRVASGHSLAALDLYDATHILPSQHGRTAVFGAVGTPELLAGALEVLASAVKSLAQEWDQPEEDVVALLRAAYLAADES